MFLILAYFPAVALAAAWTVPVGKWEYYQNISIYQARRYFDRSANATRQPTYAKAEVNPYVEMGWRDGTTLGATMSIDAVYGTNLQQGVNGHNYGVADPSIFLRQRLWQGERMVFSVQPLLKGPSYFASKTVPKSGSEQIDVELRLLGGSSFPLLGREHFANLELAYRYRFSRPENQIRADATLGFQVADAWQIMPQLSYIKGLGDIGAAGFTQSTMDEFDLLKPQLSVLYQLDDTVTLQAGVFTHVSGRNTGAGEGILLSAWLKP